MFLKLKITRSITTQIDAIKDVAKTFPNYLFIATFDGDWNMLVIMRLNVTEKNPTSKISEKFSDQVSDYRISGFQMKDVNLLNMSLVLLT